MCKFTIIGICFSEAVKPAEVTIFGFSEFLAAFALLVLVYNFTSTTYRFRTSIAPLNFRSIAYGALWVSGLGALVTDVWVAQSWFAPALGVTHASLQSLFAAILLITIMAWLFFAFVRPPVFSKGNARNYIQFVYRTAVDGSDEELADVVREVTRSAKKIVQHAPVEAEYSPEAQNSSTMAAAHDLLLLLASKRVAQKIAVLSPGTLISIALEMSAQDRIPSVSDRFIKSVIEEALINKESLLYQETREFSSDLIGLTQPLSSSLFSDFEFFDKLGKGYNSPLDVDFRVWDDFDSEQYAAYCHLTGLVFEKFVATGNIHRHSYGLYRAIKNIEGAGRKIYKIDSDNPLAWESDEISKLGFGIQFVSSSLEALDKIENVEILTLRRREGDHNNDIIDHLASITREMILGAASVKSPPDFAWSVHYGTVWGRLFSLNNGQWATEAFRFKLSRLLFNDIKDMERFPNFVGAKILGFLFNIYGLQVPRKATQYRLRERPLAAAVRSWTQKNFLSIWRNHRRVAEAAIFGGISFNEKEQLLVKTYALGTDDEPNTSELKLETEH